MKQIMILYCGNFPVQLLEFDFNIDMPANRTLSLHDTILLIWTLSAWLEISFTNN